MAVSCHQFNFGVTVFQIEKLLSSIAGIPLLLHHRKGLAFFLVLIWLWYKTSFFLTREKQETPLYAVLKAMCVVSCNCWLGPQQNAATAQSVHKRTCLLSSEQCSCAANSILVVVQFSCAVVSSWSQQSISDALSPSIHRYISCQIVKKDEYLFSNTFYFYYLAHLTGSVQLCSRLHRWGLHLYKEQGVF